MFIRYGPGLGFPLWFDIIGLILFALMIASIVWLVVVLARPGRPVRMGWYGGGEGTARASATPPSTSGPRLRSRPADPRRVLPAPRRPHGLGASRWPASGFGGPGPGASDAGGDPAAPTSS